MIICVKVVKTYLMIRFFRKIRQRLLSENKVTKYLVYAAGEIILVTLGILMALQMNTWNENRKKQIQANIYLNELKNDVQFDISNLTKMIADNQERIDNTEKIIYGFATKKELDKQETIEFINLHWPLTRESYFIPEKSTIRQIEASSHGNYITNKTLRDKLFRYFSTNDRNEKNQEVSTQLYQHNSWASDITKAVLISAENVEALYGSTLNRPELDFSGLINNEDYVVALGMRHSNTQIQNTQYELIKTMAEELLHLIENELILIEK